MEENINFANIIKILIGDKQYIELLTTIAKENNDKNIPIEDFFENIFNQYCFIILIIGFSKKVEIEKYKLRTSSNTIEIPTKEIANKYAEYIELIENKKFNCIKGII